MALAETTITSAVTVDDIEIVVASATDVAAGRFLKIDQEIMRVRKSYSSGTTVPVERGLAGSNTAAHVDNARVVHGTGEDFGRPAVGQSVGFPRITGRDVVTYSAAGAITHPTPGNDMVAVLTGTDALAMTLAVPAKNLDGSILIIVGDGKAAHTVTATGGLGDAGSGYDVGTFDASGKCSMQLVAVNEVWVPLPSPFSGTLTSIDVAIA